MNKKEIQAWRTIVAILRETGYDKLYDEEVHIVAECLHRCGQQVKKQKEVIDKAIKYFEENYYDCLDFNSSKRYKKLYHPEKLLDILKEVSE